MSELDSKVINEKLEEAFHKLNSAAKIIIIPLGLVLQTIETGEFRNFYTHENNTLFKKSQLLCTKTEMITLQGKAEKFDFVEQCTRDRQNIEEIQVGYYVKIFAALLNGLCGLSLTRTFSVKKVFI